jgi:hypothetical protein
MTRILLRLGGAPTPSGALVPAQRGLAGFRGER